MCDNAIFVCKIARILLHTTVIHSVFSKRTRLFFEGADNYPDIVFTANAAIMRGKKAYLANFRYPERQGERFFYEKWFKNNGYETVGNMDIACEGN